MSVRRFTVWMVLVGAVWLVGLTAAVLIVGVRGEATREVTYVSSACTRASQPNPSPADVAACVASNRTALLNRTRTDDCIIMRRTLKHGWYSRITRCPEK